jgi:hypothetical protein
MLSKFRRLFCDTCTVCGITLSVLLLVEISARGVARWKNRPKLTAPTSVKTIDEENQEAGATEWHSYVYWKARPHQGNFFNIDDEGMRRTLNPASGDDKKIFLFGGSTIWGSGVSDQDTVPSRLAEDLAARGWKNFQIKNFAQPGYVSTQSVIALLLALRNGDRPDVVVFYDGFNDFFSSFQNGEAGIPQNEDNRRIEFNSARSFISVGVPAPPSFLVYLRNHSVFLSTVLAPSSSLAPSLNPRFPGKGSEKLARETLKIYWENLKLLKQISEENHFGLFTFWQPTVYSRTPSPKGELAIKASLKRQFSESLETFFEEGYREVGQAISKPLHFFDLQKVLDDQSGNLFTDFCHLTGEGNRIVARAMGEILEADRQTKLTFNLPHPDSN